jgi:ERCC4-type nuclease
MLSIILDEREHQLFEKMSLFKEKETNIFGLIELKKQVLPLGDIIINHLPEIKNKKVKSKYIQSTLTTEQGEPIQSSTPTTEQGEPKQSTTPTTEQGEPIQSSTPTTEQGEPIQSSTPTTEQGEQPSSQIIAIFERKTFTDLFASIKDGRYTEQSYRLSNSIDILQTKIFYIIEGMISTLSNKEQKLLHSTITSLEIFKGFSVLRTQNTQETAEFILTMTDKIGRDLKNKKQIFGRTTTSSPPEKPYCSVVKTIKKENITPQNIGEIVLCQIPGISSVTAVSIMKQFSGSFIKLLETIKEDPKCLEKIQYETNGKLRKINKSTAETISKYFQPQNLENV